MNASILDEVHPGRSYSASVLRAARHFWTVSASARAGELADELQRKLGVQVVAVLGEGRRTIGIIRRDRLFSLLSKPFGREILGRMCVGELVEEAPVFDPHEGIFAVAQEALGPEEEGRPQYQLLVDGDGSFQGALSTQDLANYLSRMTQEDIELAGQLQERLQDRNQEVGGEGWGFEAWSRAAKGVGGDFCFSRPIGGGKAFVALCDVSGKGVAASLVVAMVWGMLRMYDFAHGLRNLLFGLNEAIVGTFHLEKYLTGFFAIFDPDGAILSAADMGHSHALLFRAGKVLVPRMELRNLPIGIERSIDPVIVRWRLAPGDGLLVYSDGLTEQEDGEGREFGERRLARTVVQALGRGAALAEAISSALDVHRGRIPQQDDMSFMFLSFRGDGDGRAGAARNSSISNEIAQGIEG
jgi:phosphoserine phosphatase RsbU/P